MARRRKPQKRKGKSSRGDSKRFVSRDLPELQQARALWLKNRFPQALQLFDTAVRKNPSNVMALTDAARAFGARFEFERAERLLERLLEIGGHRADVLQSVGQSYRMIQRPRQAIDYLHQAISRSAELFEARLELAILYERRHRLVDAEDQVSVALQLQPASLEAQLLAGRIARRGGKVGDAESMLRRVTEQPSTHWITQSQAWHELGQMYDEAGEFDEAFRAVTNGKQVIEPHAKEVLRRAQSESEGIEHLHQQLTSEHFERWRNETSESFKERVALLTGPPRSGTTLLEKILDSHPRIVSADEQEALPKFILPALLSKRSTDGLLHVDDLNCVPADRVKDERARYLRYMAASRGEPIGDRLLIDKNPSTIMLIPGMLRLFPECKLLIAVRDPRDVVVSCYMRDLPLNTVSAQFLTLRGAALRTIRDMTAWLQLRRIVGVPWLEVRYEDTVRDFEAEARRCLKSLDLPWDPAVLDYRQRLEQQSVNSPTYEAVIKPVYQSAIGRWQHYERHLTDVLKGLAPLVKEHGYK